MIGNVAQTGVVAALGSLAYTARTNRGSGSGAAREPQASDLRRPGSLLEDDRDPEFSSAIIHGMLGAAAYDRALDSVERRSIESVLQSSGANPED
jgi:uncharacterized membrane protein YebE (DUF533 family)